MSLEVKSITSAARDKRRSRVVSPLIETSTKSSQVTSVRRSNHPDSDEGPSTRDRTSFLFTDSEGDAIITEVITPRERRRMHQATHTEDLRVILAEPERRKGPLLCLPYPSEIFPTEYNKRLPEWRWRAGQSAYNEHWRNSHEYVLVALASTIGLNNFINFPMLVLKYQHGAFLYLYILIELVVGFPLLFLHLSLGQFTAKDGILVYALFPLARGVGITCLIYNLLCSLILTIELSWISFYMFASLNIKFTPSFSWTLPWINCDVIAEVVAHHVYCRHFSHDRMNQSRFYCEAVFFHDKVAGLHGNCTLINSSGEHLNDWAIHWPIVGCTLFVLVLSFLIKLRGIRGIGRFVIVMTPMMIVMLFILSLVGIILSDDQVILDASIQGIIDFFTLKRGFKDLSNFEIWFAAASHVATSLTLESGGMLYIGSHARFQSSAHYHALYIVIADICFSLGSGIIIFSHLGKQAYGKSISSDENDTDTFTRSFLHYISSAIEEMGDFGAPFMFFFFLMVLSFGLMKLITHFAVIVSPLKELFPRLKTEKWRIIINSVGALVLAVLVLPFQTTETTARFALMNLFHDPPLGYFPLVLTMITASTFIYGYGLKRLRQDIDFMLHYNPNKIYCIVWYSIPPICIILIIGYSIEDGTKHYNDVNNPRKPTDDCQAVIWFLVGLLVTPIIVVALWTVYVYYRNGALSQIRRTMDKWSKDIERVSLPSKELSQSDSLLPRIDGITRLSSTRGRSSKKVDPLGLPSRTDAVTKLNVKKHPRVRLVTE